MSYAVFCDVDETLIASKSMLDFLGFVAKHGERALVSAVEQAYGELSGMLVAGATREALNRAYYRVYAGQPVRAIEALAAAWYTRRSEEPGFYLAATSGELARHREAGARIVLVSGSFAALLEPIAQAVHATHLICTRLIVEGVCYTGEVEEPMIGEAKGRAVQEYLAAAAELEPARCYAYADDVSDIPMLDCVGQPRVVGDDPAVHAYMERRAIARK
jgi:HAD superfamily hydrolase (TIGR01490 family)